LTGTYYTGEGRMDLNLAINSINLAIVKPFAVGQLDDITGIMKGNVTIKGTTADPKVDGNFRFENASLVPTISGARFRLPDDAVAVNSQGIHFNQFTLLDSTGNKAVLDGDILTTDFKNYSFNLTLNAENFMVVDAPKQTNRMVYGKLNITTDVEITGDMTSPAITANLFVNKETDFAFIIPQTDPEVVNRQGVVNFVDKDNPVDSVDQVYVIDSLATTKLAGFDVNVNIETDSLARFTIIVDERNGDALTLKGRALLNGGIDKSGKLTLTGNYELSSGSYTVSLSFLKRQFLIQNGSTITWTGDPMTANINVTAEYLINTSSIDLMQSSLAGRSSTDVEKYKQKLPFRVILNMTGELMKPIVKFDITLPEREASQWQDVVTKLEQIRSDESELNKQVFALLLLGRFVQENPFASAAGGSTQNQIRESASRVLTDQLNNLAASLIKGVDINFGVTSGTDYETGQEANRTDLNVTVSKKLLNDRLRVSVGSNFQVEGPSPANQSTSNPAGDVMVDYQLTKDGRYLLRLYRINEYEGVLEGQVVETGASFILVFDFDKISEIFKGRKEARRIRKYNKEVTKQQEQAQQQQKQQQSSEQTPPNP
ncbi:MAG TPA: translocation/assembly module TamB domain-containing protein, partial [Parafilimonas sp.]|nr:translocation/assembly module TamB domain-containing protein [Parafilimonas sp.]